MSGRDHARIQGPAHRLYTALHQPDRLPPLAHIRFFGVQELRKVAVGEAIIASDAPRAVGKKPSFDTELTVALENRPEVLQEGAAGQPNRIALRVGALDAITPDALRFCFDVVADDTPLEGAELAIEVEGGIVGEMAMIESATYLMWLEV